MKNLMKKIRKSNKGFTLVELIIVIAIIAILTAVAAPQYIKYVERSRQGVDASSLEEVRHAVEVQAAVMEKIDSNTTVSIARDGTLSGAGSFNGNGTDAQKANFKQITDVVGPKVELKSKAAAKTGAANIVINVSTDGVVTWDGVPVPDDANPGSMTQIDRSAKLISELQAGKAS